MFNIGGGEFLVIAVLALVVLGPERLPGAMRQAGQFMREIRTISNGFKGDLKAAIAEAEREVTDGPPVNRSPQRDAMDALRRIGDRAAGGDAAAASVAAAAGVAGADEVADSNDTIDTVDPIALAAAELAELEAEAADGPI